MEHVQFHQEVATNRGLIKAFPKGFSHAIYSLGVGYASCGVRNIKGRFHEVCIHVGGSGRELLVIVRIVRATHTLSSQHH